jgi:hypothetical protein
MALGSSGELTDVRGPFGLQGTGSKRTRSGILKIPVSFQTANGVGPYALGLGAYTDLMAQGGHCAMGLSLYAIPDPGAIPDASLIPMGSYKALAARGATPRGRRIWYGYNFTTMSGKGPVNLYEGPPGSPGSTWQSPTSDGNAYWMWGDKYVGGAWLDGGTRNGLMMVGDFATGRGFYEFSRLNSDGRCTEIHVFDPQHLQEVLAGTRASDAVEPVNMFPLPEQDSGRDVGIDRKCYAAYDDAAKVLYILKAGFGAAYTCRIFAYSVNA